MTPLLDAGTGRLLRRVVNTTTIAATSLAGCSRYHFDSVRPVELSQRRVAKVGERVAGYGRLEGRTYPSANGSPLLRVYLSKTVESSFLHEARVQSDEVYKRQRTKVEAAAPLLGSSLLYGGLLALVSPEAGAGLVVVGAAKALGTPAPKPQFRIERKPAAIHVVQSVRSENSVEPAAFERLVVAGRSTVVTGADGVAVVRAPLEQYDAGVLVSHAESGATYLIKRVQGSRAVAAKWADPLKRLLEAAGLAHLVVEVVRMAERIAARVSPALAATRVVLEALAGKVVELLLEQAIDAAGRRTESYSDWAILSVR